jgi:hypothetical protein
MVCYCATSGVPPAESIVGPIVKVSLAGDDMVVLSDPSDAEELASARHLNYYFFPLTDCSSDVVHGFTPLGGLSYTPESTSRIICV